MSDSIFIRHAGGGMFSWAYRDGCTGLITRTEMHPYPVPYTGSVVPLNFVCPCGGSVVTDWLYYYSPELHPHRGEWGGVCLRCKRQFTQNMMRGE